jgi:hypothetical protein
MATHLDAPSRADPVEVAQEQLVGGVAGALAGASAPSPDRAAFAWNLQESTFEWGALINLSTPLPIFPYKPNIRIEEQFYLKCMRKKTQRFSPLSVAAQLTTLPGWPSLLCSPK